MSTLVRAPVLIALGLAAFFATCFVGDATHDPASLGGDLYYAAVILAATASVLVLAAGLWRIRPTTGTVGPLEYLPGVGYRTFVAWRYLLERRRRVSLRAKLSLVLLWLVHLGFLACFGFHIEPTHPLAYAQVPLTMLFYVALFGGILRHSKLALGVVIAGVALAMAALGFLAVARAGSLPMVNADNLKVVQQGVGIAILVIGLVVGLAIFFGSLRGYFTFFTTVPIGGVWVGTSALVLVLAVMSGFETDLRDKILGSNAHIQVTKEDGDFVDWREVKGKLDRIPGIIGSTPYASSEVVIAANNLGSNVIIKGIDPATVGTVTNLVEKLKDPSAMQRLEPQATDAPDRTVAKPRDVTDTDAPPPDMPIGGDPIDFSGDGSDDAVTTPAPSPDAPGAPGAGSAAPPRPAGDPDVEPVSPYGDDDTMAVLDHLASPLIDWLVGASPASDEAVRVIDVDPSRSRRTLALPGILVGQELVKQTHLYEGEEVRLVSPLSDPSNPDATGTPIPFNRDYRVAGVFYTGMYEYDLKFVYVTLDSLQDFLDLGDTVDGIEIRLESADDTDAYVPTDDGPGLIREALGPGYRVQDWRELNRSLFSALKLEKIAMFLVLGIVILVASFAIIGNLIMVVVEKAREIALLKTLGASDLGIMQLFAVQGMIIGLIGTALGIATGLFGCYLLERFGLPLDPDVYYINRLPIHVDPESVAASALTGVLISILATLYPALLAARVRPAAGMRH